MPKIRRKHIGRRLKTNQKLILSKQKELKESESEQESNKKHTSEGERKTRDALEMIQ